jgi:hypothetical protein
MVRRTLRLAGSLGAVVLAVACAGNPEGPLSPSAADSASAANPDGSLLKASAPTLISPADGERIDTIRPSVVFGNSQGRFGNADFSYRLQVLNSAGDVTDEFVVAQGANGQTTFAAAADQPWDTEFRWRVRAELDGLGGPWSAVWSFKTPQRVLLGDPSGPVGGSRNIDFFEAYDIIYAIYQAGRYDIGSRSSREQRNLYLEAAVAAIHFGHGKWNPRGGDSDWCIKNGGPGRPQADDVIVRCGSRDAWDLIGGIGGPNPTWDWHYIDRLPGIQAVYPPNPAAMSILP